MDPEPQLAIKFGSFEESYVDLSKLTDMDIEVVEE